MGRNYYTFVEVTDYGPFITKIILPMPGNVKADAVNKDCFSAYVERKDKKGEVLQLPKSWMARDDKEPSRGFVEILDAYPSCRYGNKKEESDYVTLAMKYGPSYTLSAAISAPNGFNEFVISDYRITQLVDIETDAGKVSGQVYDICAGRTMPYSDDFRHGRSSYELALNYGYYVPQMGKGKRPLIIWLHGAGEGGQDPKIAYSGNKVTNLATPEIQKKFDGAYILAPQTPTFWLDDGSGKYGRSGKSKYVEALKALIDEFIDKNEGIDRDRVYIGGDSNGGFMTMRMAVDYPEMWAGVFPVCEALYNEVISDEDINKLKDLPIWFTHAANDPVCKPDETVVPTYKRLLAAGAKNVHFTFWDKVVDLHGLFKNENGEPYEYIGHFTWIPMLNDDCKLDYDGKPVVVDGKEVTLLDWLALQHK